MDQSRASKQGHDKECECTYSIFGSTVYLKLVNSKRIATFDSQAKIDKIRVHINEDSGKEEARGAHAKWSLITMYHPLPSLNLRAITLFRRLSRPKPLLTCLVEHRRSLRLVAGMPDERMFQCLLRRRSIRRLQRTAPPDKVTHLI